jgi:hypothetical protein
MAVGMSVGEKKNPIGPTLMYHTLQITLQTRAKKYILIHKKASFDGSKNKDTANY